MPSPSTHASVPLLVALQEQIVNKFGRSIISNSDCEQLSNGIEQRTGKLVSINTLRRFFGAMPSTGRPSQQTLDILAGFCGYIDFLDFQKSHVQTGTYALTFAQTNELHTVLGNTPLFYTTLDSILRLAFVEQNIPFLKSFFDLNVFTNHDYTYHPIKQPLFTFGQALRTSPALFNNLTHHYAGHPQARALYFEWFVDYDYLPTRHHFAIEQYIQQAHRPEDRLFSYCVLFFKAFLTGNRKTCSELLQKINAIDIEKGTHPFPAGRKMACNLLAQRFIKNHADPVLIKACFDLEKQMPRNGLTGRDLPSYQMLLTEAFCWCGLYDEAVAMAELALTSYNTVITEHSQDVISTLMMYYSQALLKTGKTESAIANFKKIDTAHFNIPNRGFSLMNYYQIRSQITENTNDKESLAMAKRSRDIARNYRFNFFEGFSYA